MSSEPSKENKGAWIVHHGRKLALDANGAAEFPALDEAAKAASLLAKLGESDEITLTRTEVKAIAVASGLNPRHELTGLLDVLQRKRLIDQSQDSIAVLGVTTRGALRHAADLFDDAEPSALERASLELSDMVSKEPMVRSDVGEIIAAEFSLATADLSEFLNRAEQVGFVDAEGEADSRLLFNGNLFRRDAVAKTAKVLGSLGTAEETKVGEVRELLDRKGCVTFDEIERMLGIPLFEKLRAAGLYDLNVVGNERGEHVYVTSPAAFHKFVSPLVDDCFDMAKSLVSALTYGITARPASTGRIVLPEILIGKLVRGGEVGPATAIGQDYRVLEVNRVVRLRPDPQHAGRFYMRLLKREVGELALKVLTTGNASAESLTVLPGAPMSTYTGPEAARANFRKRQSKPSRRHTQDILEAVRGGKDFK